MADWKDISTNYFGFTYKDTANTYPSGEMYISLQYDVDSATTESVKVRFKYVQTGSDVVYGTDGMYILYDANNTNDLRSLYKIKGTSSGEEAYYTSAITLTKKYDAGQFFLQDIWVCNTGGGTVNTSTMKITYETGTKTAYNWFKKGGVREGYAYRQTSGQYIPINTSKTVATNVTATKPTIIDNKDNTFTVTGVKGTAGDNNAVKSTTLYYKRVTDSDWVKASSLKAENIEITINNTNASATNYKSKATQTVQAKVVVAGTYGDAVTSETASTPVKQYVGPNNPGKPAVSYEKNRFTLKEPWKISWTAATKTNESSPVVGYRIRIYKKAKGTSTFDSIPFYDSSGNLLTKDVGSNDEHRYGYDTENINTSLEIDPAKQKNISVGDTIHIGLYAYTRDSKGNIYFLSSSLQQFSPDLLIHNAGVMRVKVGKDWKEGQVWVKVNGKWKEAESVQTKVNGAWKESR